MINLLAPAIPEDQFLGMTLALQTFNATFLLLPRTRIVQLAKLHSNLYYNSKYVSVTIRGLQYCGIVSQNIEV